MSIWKPTTTATEPVTKLTNWAIFKVTAPKDDQIITTYHIAGLTSYGEGRASSAIVSSSDAFNLITRSGRKYELVGPPGLAGDGQYVWNYWLQINSITPENIEEVTLEQLQTRS